MFMRWIDQLDRILRGQTTGLAALRAGSIDVPVRGMWCLISVLAVIYGTCMGSFAMIRTGGEAWPQMIASAVKLPFLFFLTVVVTLPSLYVFNALVGSTLAPGAVVRLLTAALAVMLTVLASLGPIVAFFSLSTESYPFMQLMNVAAGGVAGVLGLTFLLRTLNRIVTVHLPPNVDRSSAVATARPTEPSSSPVAFDTDVEAEDPPGRSEAAGPTRKSEPAPDEPAHALDAMGMATDARARVVFRIWVTLFALVGAQMSWILRPFIGHPDQPFTLFRKREDNFFEAVFNACAALFGG